MACKQCTYPYATIWQSIKWFATAEAAKIFLIYKRVRTAVDISLLKPTLHLQCEVFPCNLLVIRLLSESRSELQRILMFYLAGLNHNWALAIPLSPWNNVLLVLSRLNRGKKLGLSVQQYHNILILWTNYSDGDNLPVIKPTAAPMMRRISIAANVIHLQVER